MTTDELKVKVEAYREDLMRRAERPQMGGIIRGPAGPVTIGIIDVLVEAIITQDQRIKALEDKLGAIQPSNFRP